MKRTANILLLVFYTFGVFCLPTGDFSALQDLPEMYRHCKATEDKDMTAFDFITDHLINIDALFDKHDNGDEQKPHEPMPAYQQQHQQLTYSVVTYNSFSIIQFNPEQVNPEIASEQFVQSEYISKIFRPPIA